MSFLFTGMQQVAETFPDGSVSKIVGNLCARNMVFMLREVLRYTQSKAKYLTNLIFMFQLIIKIIKMSYRVSICLTQSEVSSASGGHIWSRKRPWPS